MLPAVTAYELESRDGLRDDMTLIELAGELDLTNVSEIERRVEELATPGSTVVLDLNRVTFVDSAALHLLFRLARRFGGSARFALVVEPNALVARVLGMVGLGEVANLCSSVEAVDGRPPA